MIPLHNHSEFSALDGLSKVDEIAARIESLGLGGAFLTDHETAAGWRAFRKAMDKRGLFSGLGLEAYQSRFVNRSEKPSVRNERDQFHVLLAAMSARGVRSLYRMSDAAARTGYYYKPRVDWDLLERHNEGVICTSACMGGLVARGIRNDDKSDLYRYLRIFGDRFFMEIHTYDSEEQREINRVKVAWAAEHGIPLVYANDAHYATPEEYAYHEYLIAVQYREAHDFELHHPPCLYIMGEDDVRKRLSYLPQSAVDEAISNSDVIADLCREATLPESSFHLPKFVPRVPTKERNEQFFLRLVEEGLEERYGADYSEEVHARAHTELDVYFTALDGRLIDYILITWDFCNWAREQEIKIGPGRGSAPGSIVAYALGITDVDPIKHGLFFERFYNAGREKGLPDIDIDFEQANRDKLDDFFRSRYGEYNVLPIGNHIRMKPLAAIDKLAKVFRIPSKDKDMISKIIKQTPDINIMSGDQTSWRYSDHDRVVVAVLEEKDDDGNVHPSPVSEQLKQYMNDYPDYFDCAMKLTGRIHTYGVHASAVVVSDVDLRDYMPTMMAKGDDDSNRRAVTAIEMHEVEELGFMKSDRLGLKTLDVIKMCEHLTNDKGYETADWDNMPEEFWQNADLGRGVGLFQIKQGAAARIIQRLRPRSLDDLGAITALNRPGPLRSGVVDRFLARRAGNEPVVFPHPFLESILANTYGDFLYQEQVIAYFRAIGYNLIEADSIRKMLGKKLKADMDAEYPRYAERAAKHMTKKNADEIWRLIVDFSKYSFNKAHSVAYGKILAITMWYKWKYPSEFIMACVMIHPKNESGMYVREGKRIGVEVLPPDINHSAIQISNVDGTIFFGLADVKEVGVGCAKWIISHRPYTSYAHFIEKLETEATAWREADKTKRTKSSPKQTVPSDAIENLHKVGAFDILGDEYPWGLRSIHQEELLGIALANEDGDLLESNLELLSETDDLTVLNEIDYIGETVRVPGVVSSVRFTQTKKGKDMAFVTVNWDGQEEDFAVFEPQVNAYKFLLKPRMAAVWTVKITERGKNLESATKLKRDRLTQ